MINAKPRTQDLIFHTGAPPVAQMFQIPSPLAGGKGVRRKLLTCWVMLLYGLGVNNVCAESSAIEICPHMSRTVQKHFEICHVAAQRQDGVYLLTTQAYFGLSRDILDTLDSGVPVTFVYRIELYRDRNWMWDDTVAVLEQRYQIQYHTFSSLYIVTNLNSKARFSFVTRESALNAISHVKQFPIIDERLLLRSSAHYGRIRTRLGVWDLPSPLRMWAYLASDWRVKSEWFTWRL